VPTPWDGGCGHNRPNGSSDWGASKPMCGLAGIVTADENAVASALPRMVRAQNHRGPDDSGQTILRLGDLALGLGFTRLSILDLTPAARQPMIDGDTGDALIYNGEIYNFRSLREMLRKEGFSFTSTGDTEVLLKALVAWGPRALSRLEGMFAFAYYDRSANTLLLARDPLGIKPLYFSCKPGALVFASEVRAVLASGLASGELDRAGLAGYLAYGSVQDPYTLFKWVRSFPAGCWMEIPPKAVISGSLPEPCRHWVFPAPQGSADAREAAQLVRETLERAVRDHLVSDVPLGFFLSSGLDSTVVTSLAACSGADVRTLTVGFPGHDHLNEGEIAHRTAAALGVSHTEIFLTEANALEATVQWLSALDLPSIDGMNIFVISRVARAVGLTVAISGQGGDELFGGYPSFRDIPRVRQTLRRLALVPAPLRSRLADMLLAGKTEAVRLKLGDMVRSDASLLSLYLHRRRTLSDSQMATLGFDAKALGLSAGFLAPEVVAGLPIEESDSTWTISQLETRLYLGNMLLRDGDANGMANSLEIRVPMLDRRLIDLVLALPGSVRLPAPKADKHLLRAACRDLLRPEVTAQAKLGFLLPIGSWMLGPLREVCEGAMREVENSGVVDPAGASAIWQAFLREPGSSIWSRAWELCVLGRYLQNLRGATWSRAAA
jgi:asparagine synthase (glutamine-hydrolysing)